QLCRRRSATSKPRRAATAASRRLGRALGAAFHAPPHPGKSLEPVFLEPTLTHGFKKGICIFGVKYLVLGQILFQGPRRDEIKLFKRSALASQFFDGCQQ